MTLNDYFPHTFVGFLQAQHELNKAWQEGRMADAILIECCIKSILRSLSGCAIYGV